MLCGVSASTREDLENGAMSGRNVSSDGINETMEYDMPIESMHGLNSSHLRNSGLKDDDAMEDGCEWESGPTVYTIADKEEEKASNQEINIELEIHTSSSSAKKAGKQVSRRANAKDKEFAELVHKAHLLCMIARGRLVDTACDDPMLQASLLSIVPDHIHFNDLQRVDKSEIGSFVKWFQSTFQVFPNRRFASTFEDQTNDDLGPCLLNALHKREGSSEEVAALSVSVLRALGVNVRYVMLLDVLSLKPDSSSLEASEDWDASNFNQDSFSQRVLGTKLALSLDRVFSQCAPQLGIAVTNAPASLAEDSSSSPRSKSCENTAQKQPISKMGKRGGKQKVEGPHGSSNRKRPKNMNPGSMEKMHEVGEDVVVEVDGTNIATDALSALEAEKKRKGDLEFELQLAMAMAATSATASKSNEKVCKEMEINKSSQVSGEGKAKSPASLEKEKGLHKNIAKPMAAGGTAVWSRKLGALLNWAEVFCDGKDGGRWVHVDAGKGLLDSAELVEEASRSCKAPLCYALAFAGNGAKDVTRRYVTSWSAVAPLRVSSHWWNITLAPLRELEVVASSLNLKRDKDIAHLRKDVGVGPCNSPLESGPSSRHSHASTLSSLEDMELDIKSWTEPLPRSQQAYRNHHLYVIEKWLTKYQILHPRGPVIGCCAGHPVFPRTCVQDLHTAERWLREGLKVRPDEMPAKTVRNPRSTVDKSIDDSSGDMGECTNEAPMTALFGKWQTEPWNPPPAINGIVPKNERGNVELWSEKCLPPGTVHISLPWILPVAKKLEIDFAPALVGFEIRNRRSVPVFEGIVVCQEYETILLEAHAEEEYRRKLEADRKKEVLAVARWCQLFRSIATRQRLQAAYEVCKDDPCKNLAREVLLNTEVLSENPLPKAQEDSRSDAAHEHFFPEEHQIYDEDSGIRTKICVCGFTLSIEEM